MQQLDLFGMPIPQEPIKKEKVQPVEKPARKPEEKEYMLATVEAPGIPEPVLQLEVEIANAEVVASPLQENNLIFTDGKIGIKLKRKTVEVVEEKPVKTKKEKLKPVPQKRGRKSFKEMDEEIDLIEIPGDEELYKKNYYPIRVVSKWFRINTSLLRFWSNEFDILQPRTNGKGDRLFRPEDVKNIELIYFLLRQRKFTLEGAKEYLKMNRKKADTQLQLNNTLQKFKGFLLELKANLQA